MSKICHLLGILLGIMEDQVQRTSRSHILNERFDAVLHLHLTNVLALTEVVILLVN
jgi:hypothetical protein